MKCMDNIKSQLKRCRVFKVMNKFKSIWKWQIIMARHVEAYFCHGKGDMCKPSDSDMHGEESWVSWDIWIGWDEIEDSWKMGRPDGSTNRREKESKGGSTEESGSGWKEHIPGKAEEPGSTRKVGRGYVEGIFEGIDLIACG